eukprot:TRINITY_DN4003_c1_g1_i2.p1 TRINITY_DN4003_c1_g1~~TRINITY_DN4003_c1_g1_i2.p1  ORF type:complete len:744 (+),score=163.11 TRINITY_DN4003_c1_g1_i2:309-2234(+)
MSTQTHMPMIVFSFTLVSNNKAYFVGAMMPLAITIQAHDCDYEANTNCNRVDTQYLMLKMKLMLEVSRTVEEKEFALDYFSHGFTNEDKTIKLGGTALLHNTYTMILTTDSEYTMVRHCEHPEYKGMSKDEYNDIFLIVTERSMDEIFIEGAAQTYGTYGRFSFGDTIHDFIGLATHATVVTEGEGDTLNSLHEYESYALIVAYPDINGAINPFCDSSYNNLCSLENAEQALGRFQATILPAVDESDEVFRVTRLNAAYDRTSELGRIYGLEAELLNSDGYMLVPYELFDGDISLWDKTYFEAFPEDTNDLVVIVDELFEASRKGDVVANYMWGVYPCLSYVGYQIYDESEKRMLSNMVSYYDVTLPTKPVHDLEVEREYVSTRSIHNIRSFMGEAVHYLKKERSMTQIGNLLAESRAFGLKPFIIIWELVDGVEVPSLIMIERAFPFSTTSFKITDTNLLKFTVPFLISLGILSAEQWNQISLSTDGYTWSRLSWLGSELFGNFYRTYHPTTGTRMTFGFSSLNTINSYDEACPLHETMPCSEGTMDAMLSIVARDSSLYDERAIYTLGSTDSLRPSGDMGVTVFETDGVIIYNSRSLEVSGWTMEEWAGNWNFPIDGFKNGVHTMAQLSSKNIRTQKKR